MERVMLCWKNMKVMKSNSFKIVLVSLWMGLSTIVSLASSSKYYVELPYENVNGKLIIEAKVEGISGKFVFDTGAPFYISYPLSQKITSKQTRNQDIIDSGGNKIQVEKTVVESLHLGPSESGLMFLNVPANIIPQGNIVEQLGVDGIIGCDIMPNAVVRMDSRRHVIIITDDISPFKISMRNRMKLTVNAQNIPFVEVNLGKGVIETPMFDCGSAAFYELCEATAEKFSQAGAFAVIAKGYGSAGLGIGGTAAVMERKRMKISDLRLGSGKFHNVVTETIHGTMSRFGSGILAYGVVTLDFGNSAFYYEPFEVGKVIDLYEPKWNIDISYDDGHVVVAGVWDDKLAEKIQLGDVIKAIDGKAVPEVNLQEALRKGLLKIKKSKAELTLLSKNGKEYHVKITKK